MKRNDYSSWFRYLGLTAQLLAFIGLAVFAGIKLDEKFHLNSLFTVTLPLFILAVIFYKLIKDTGRKNKNDGSDK